MTPEAARPQATSTRVAATRPTRSGNPRRCCVAMLVIFATTYLAGFPQHISHPAQGVQQALLPRVDLAPQVRDIGLDDVDVAAEVVAPDMVENLRFTQD